MAYTEMARIGLTATMMGAGYIFGECWTKKASLTALIWGVAAVARSILSWIDTDILKNPKLNGHSFFFIHGLTSVGIGVAMYQLGVVKGTTRTMYAIAAALFASTLSVLFSQLCEKMIDFYFFKNLATPIFKKH